MKTTILELSEQLKEAGAKQGVSDYKHAKFPSWEPEYMLQNDMRPGKAEYSYDSFDCHELLERLPRGAFVEKEVEEAIIDDLLYEADLNGDDCLQVYGGNTPAEALGKLYLWCLENGHCKE